MKDPRSVFGEEWQKFLHDFLASQEFKSIENHIKNLVSTGFFISPSLKDTFNAFKYCPLNKIKVVILTTNTYSNGECDGLALSYSKDGFKPPTVLDKVFDAIEQDVADGLYLERRNDLRRLAEQGVLLLNCDLTSIRGQLRGHIDLWRPFISFVIKHLSEQTACAFALLGTDAHTFRDLIDHSRNECYCREHPFVAVKQKRKWEHGDLFSKLNYTTDFVFNEIINWTI